MSIDYLDVEMLEAATFGPFTVPVGAQLAMPEYEARSMAASNKARIIGPGTPAKIITLCDTDLAVPAGATSTEVENIIQTIGVEQTEDAPWGVGREVQIAPGVINVPSLLLSSCQSLTGAGQGATVLKFNKHKTVTEETGVIVHMDDTRQKRGFVGRSTLRNLMIDGSNDATDIAEGAPEVHGFLADYPDGEDDAPAPTIEYCQASRCTGSGWVFRGRSQLITKRMKASDNNGWGAELIDVKDSKNIAPGLTSKKGALRLYHCSTPKFVEGDYWLPDDWDGFCTVLLENQARAHFSGGEISGRVFVLGRNDNATNEWEVGANCFTKTHFKIDPNVAPSFLYTRDDDSTVTVSAMIYAEDADDLELINPRFQYDDNKPGLDYLAATPDYLIQVGSREDSAHRGHVTINGIGGLFHRRSRVGDTTTPPMLTCKKHICNDPRLIEFDGFMPGQLELFPYPTDAALRPRNVVYCDPADPTNVPKADHPLGYLFATWFQATPGTLDDVNANFTLVAAPASAPSLYRWGMRTG